MQLTWGGNFQGSGAYPTINRHLTEALERQGVQVLRNIHNEGVELTPIQVSCTYPPLAPQVRHAFNVVSLAWEFPGVGGTPLSFIRAFDQVDAVFSHSAWSAAQFRLVTDTPVYATPLGFDPLEFTPDGMVADWNELFRDEAWANRADTVFCLWVGGTDKRHGLDIAIETIKRLPDNYHLIAKTSIDYPPASVESHPRIHLLRRDFVSLAPLYRACSLFLNTARAVGFALPVLEAQASGAKIVSTACPPVLEHLWQASVVEHSQWMPFVHHIHDDAFCTWLEPQVDDLVEKVLNIDTPNHVSPLLFDEWRSVWDWDSSARKVIEAINHATIKV